MTRFTSRAWKRNAIRPFGSFSTPAWRATVHVPASAHWLRRNGGSEYGVRLVERGVGFGGEAAALAVADVRLGRLERPPVGGHLEPLRARPSTRSWSTSCAPASISSCWMTISVIAYSPSPKWWKRMRPSASAR